MSHLLIRAEGNGAIGTGHIMRCLALAQAWQATGGSVSYVLASSSPTLEARLLDEGVQVDQITALPGSRKDAQQTLSLAEQFRAGWVVVDGYQFEADYQHAIKTAGLRLLFLDDYGHANPYTADIVLNQNIEASASLYPDCEAYTTLLLGPRYSLLRREFWGWRGSQRQISPTVHNVLVTLGGADPDNITLKIIQALQQAQRHKLEVVVVVGASNPHYETLRLASEASRHTIQLKRNVTDMPSLMAWADLAISAGGSTCWELAFMGLPNLILILADNQQRIAEGLDSAGISINLGSSASFSSTTLAKTFTQLALSPEERAIRSQRGQALVDGLGASRVAKCLQTIGLSLRPVQADDCRLIWEWTNDPVTRATSFSSEPIPWEHHTGWFAAKLVDPHSLFYIILDAAAKPVGQIRYEIEASEAVVSISLASNQRGRGYSIPAIRLASDCVFENSAVKHIHAYIKPDNLASIQAFMKAGFKNKELTNIQGCSALHFELSRDKNNE